MYLFDKSDEALLNDYEDILNSSEDSSLMKGFQILIDDFVNNNPVSVKMPIADEWDEKALASDWSIKVLFHLIANNNKFFLLSITTSVNMFSSRVLQELAKVIP